MKYPGDDVARAAFDVMMRRGWNPMKVGDEWKAEDGDGGNVETGFGNGIMPTCRFWPDPFTALIQADEWYEKTYGESMNCPENNVVRGLN